MKMITTDFKKQKFWEEMQLERTPIRECMHVVNVYPQIKDQTVQGFGGAFTEASAHNYQKLNQTEQKKVIEGYFGKEGLCYNMGRITIHSCDFGLGNYTYLDGEDESLQSFSLEHDKKEILPMIHAAQETSPVPMEFMASPWSPPAFMKSNGEMNHGGILKEQYCQSWADYMVKFLEAYEKEGVQIGKITVQNEPEAVQTWDSCTYTAQQEADFVRGYLGPALSQSGHGDVSIFIWDHNKDVLLDRVEATLKSEATQSYVKGAALHWYTGDHFEAVELVRKEYPGLELFFTEGCVEYSRFAEDDQVMQAEMYAHDMLGNLNAGISGYLDWNLLLDDMGGPNHVGNFCAAPMMYKKGTMEVEKRLTYYYIGHFSRYITPKSVRIGTTRYTDKLEVTGFLTPQNQRVVVILNKSDSDTEVTLKENGMGASLTIGGHSIVTVLYDED